MASGGSGGVLRETLHAGIGPMYPLPGDLRVRPPGGHPQIAHSAGAGDADLHGNPSRSGPAARRGSQPGSPAAESAPALSALPGNARAAEEYFTLATGLLCLTGGGAGRVALAAGR